MTVLPPPQDPTPTSPGVPPGWYHDPASQQMRWWDGRGWTEHFAPTGPVVFMPAAVAYAPRPRPTTNRGAIASTVLGAIGIALLLLGVFTPALLLVLPVSLVGLILGIGALPRAARLGGLGRIPAVIGTCLSATPFVIVLIAVIVSAATRR